MACGVLVFITHIAWRGLDGYTFWRSWADGRVCFGSTFECYDTTIPRYTKDGLAVLSGCATESSDASKSIVLESIATGGNRDS